MPVPCAYISMQQLAVPRGHGNFPQSQISGVHGTPSPFFALIWESRTRLALRNYPHLSDSDGCEWYLTLWPGPFPLEKSTFQRATSRKRESPASVRVERIGPGSDWVDLNPLGSGCADFGKLVSASADLRRAGVQRVLPNPAVLGTLVVLS